VCTQAVTDDWEFIQKEDNTTIPVYNKNAFEEHNQSIHPIVNDSFSTLHDVSPTKTKPKRYSYNSNIGSLKASTSFHPISYAFGSTTTPFRRAIGPHESSTSATTAAAPTVSGAPAVKPTLKGSTPVQRQSSSSRSPVSASKRFDPILMNQRYPYVSDNKSKWVSETSRSYSLKAVAPFTNKKRF